ncbi:MAG: DUF881 domain-containing protein [Clostridium sp.]|nr:DUF881 domain-containing protein [Clostridium sp.]
MKNCKAGVFIFIASIITGVLITSNLNLKTKITKRIFLNSSSYQQQYVVKSNLQNENNHLRNKLFDLNVKYFELKKSEKNGNIFNTINNELNNVKMSAGETNVTGQGIIINLNDNTDKYKGHIVNTDNDIMSIIHNYDVDYIVNDLKSAGAEAISVNGQRIVNSTEIYCIGPFIRVNGAVVMSPFFIKAIGNEDKLKDYMLADTNYIALLKLRRIKINITKSNNIDIDAYNGQLSHEYIKSKN